MTGKIREAGYEDLAAVKKMTDEYIGQDFYSMSFLREICDADNKYLYVYANDRDEAVAYLYIFVSTLEEALRILHITYEESGLAGAEPESKVGVYKTTCTRKEYRNQGVLAAFLDSLEDIVRQNRVERILAPALKSPTGLVPVQTQVLEAGFHKVGEGMRPWSGIDAYCPYCKSMNCKCQCVLYVKEMTYE